MILDIGTDGTGYVINPVSSINGLGVTQPNISFEEVGMGVYSLYVHSGGGRPRCSLWRIGCIHHLIKPSGNVGGCYTDVTNVNLVLIDAHPPVITEWKFLPMEVGVGGTVQVTITADEEGYDSGSGYSN